MTTIDVGVVFYHRLANRDSKQGDGKHTAVEFRTRFLSSLDNPQIWKSSSEPTILDFKNVKKIAVNKIKIVKIFAGELIKGRNGVFVTKIISLTLI